MTAIPKPARGTAAAAKRKRRMALERADRDENTHVTARSGGRCELREVYADSIVPYRCTDRAVHVHHRIGGRGRRGRGESAAARAKLHLCARCHEDIHWGRLVPAGAYWRRGW